MWEKEGNCLPTQFKIVVFIEESKLYVSGTDLDAPVIAAAKNAK